MSTKLKIVTPTCWLVLSDSDERVGLLTARDSQYTLLTNKHSRVRFTSKEDVNKHFNRDIFSDVTASNKDTIVLNISSNSTVGAYPTKFVDPVDVFVTGCTLPLFAKNAKSSTYFSAGYYCLGFPKMWQPAFCPKYQTLLTYGYKGPFTTEEEMQVTLVQLRRDANERDKKTRSTNQ